MEAQSNRPCSELATATVDDEVVVVVTSGWSSMVLSLLVEWTIHRFFRSHEVLPWEIGVVECDLEAIGGVAKADTAVVNLTHEVPDQQML